MIYHNTTHADVAESFLLGLSCLVGGDQFFILVSKTDASPKTQSYIAITTVLSTLFLAFVFYDQYNRSLFDITHVLYLVLLVIWGLILYQNVKNPFIITYYISILGMVMTFLVIISCVHYLQQKELLASFLSGMLFARLLPTLLWIFVHQKKAESKSNLSSLSARLALFRLVFCIISMILKFTSGNLDFSRIRFDTVESYDWYVIRTYAFKNIWEHFNKLFKHFKKSFDETLSIPYFILVMTTTLFLFFYSVITHLGLPPVVHKFSHLHSQHLYSRMDIMRTVSHLLGVGLGTKYPVSKTADTYSFGGISLSFLVYFFGFTIVNNYWKFTSPIHLYTTVILTGFILGYVWSYSLGLIKNIFFVKTCILENGLVPCCGDRFANVCYCSYTKETISLSLQNNPNKGYYSKFSCSDTKFHYSTEGKMAVLLLIGKDSTCSKTCSVCCQRPCSNIDCCLKIIGIYKLEAVTVSSCEDCQLTVRLEGSCCNSSKCANCCGSGHDCGCNSGNSCLCLKCCKQSGKSECKCCIHLCNGSGACQCKIDKEEGVRVFVCFNNSKCCIREISPNLSKEFTADLKIQNQFDIRSIVVSDCCHTDLTVDLKCTMKNNFFRVGPINYPKKTIKPYSLTLMRSGIECCKADSGGSCCCKNIDLATVCVKYDGTEKNCEIKCVCKGSDCCCRQGGLCGCNVSGTNCCCCLTCELTVDRLDSFYNKIEPVRVKLVLILWFFFLIFLMIVISETSKSKNKKLKSYQFFPIKSFETVNKEVEKNGMNSMYSVLQRLRSAQENIFLQLFGEKDKKGDLDHMLQLCKCAFDPCSLNTLRHYVLSKSSMLISSPHYVNRRLNLELVKWSYCVGFIYTYIMLMFFNIQEYFLKWDQVWQREYINYTRIMNSKFNNLTNKSKSSMSLMCEKGADHKTTLYTETSKKGGWDSSNDELDIHANLNERETEMNKSPPHRVDLRLMFFLDKWKHRVENLIFWTQNETNVYDWTGLIEEYPKIRTWFFKFLPHIQAASHEMNVPIERLNKGTEILESKTLNLIS